MGILSVSSSWSEALVRAHDSVLQSNLSPHNLSITQAFICIFFGGEAFPKDVLGVLEYGFWIFFSLCVCVRIYLSLSCRAQRSTSVPFSIALHLTFWDRLLVNPELTSWLDWLPRRLQDIPVLISQALGLQICVATGFFPTAGIWSQILTLVQWAPSSPISISSPKTLETDQC